MLTHRGAKVLLIVSYFSSEEREAGGGHEDPMNLHQADKLPDIPVTDRSLSSGSEVK